MRTIVGAGARAAAPGEFTFRAFRNGRVSLAQAEAVEEVVRAGTDAARRQALARLGGGGRARALEWRNRLLGLAAGLEAALDFPDEEAGAEDIAAGLAALAGEIIESGAAGLAESTGRVERNLPHAALVGLTNAGKSSLFNALLDGGADAQERDGMGDGTGGGPGGGGSLVSSEESTTRDCLRREAAWHGIRLILSDNPGYHPEGGGIAGAAAARGWRGSGDEDAAVWVLDGSAPLAEKEAAFASGLANAVRCGVIIVLNKRDISSVVTSEAARGLAERAGLAVRAVTEASARAGLGLDTVRRAISADLEATGGTGEGSAVWNGREALQLARALAACRAAERELIGACRLELAAEEVRSAAAAFSLALGEGYAEEALGRIFSTFCIGK